MKDKIHNLLIHYSTTILSALQQMDKEKKKLLIVVDDENKFVSLLFPSYSPIRNLFITHRFINTQPITFL